MHEALAEGAAADDDAAVVVLHGAAHDFGGRGGVFVDEDGEAALTEEAVAAGTQLRVFSRAALRVDHQTAAREKFAGDINGRAEIAAAVDAEVEDEFLHALFLQLGDGIVYFLA